MKSAAAADHKLEPQCRSVLEHEPEPHIGSVRVAPVMLSGWSENGRSMAFSRLAAFLQRYGERLAGDSQTNLPFPDKIGGGR